MKFRRFWLIKPVNTALMATSLILTAILFFYNKILFFVLLPIVLALVGYSAYKLYRIQHDLYNMISDMSSAITDSHEGSLVNFPLSAVILTADGEIVWYNDNFREAVLLNKQDIFGYNISDVTKLSAEQLFQSKENFLCYNEKYFKAYCLKTTSHGTTMYLVYFVDISELYETKLMAEKTKPVVMLTLIDNYDELTGNENEGGKARLLSEVQSVIQDFVDSTNGFIKNLDKYRYIILMEKQNLDEIIKNRFDILDKVRSIPTPNGIPITLSIGVAEVKKSLAQAESDARQALDMCLGRGGDQVSIRTEGGYEFFGGISKGVEKRTKVKTRIVASAMVELINEADNILIMGHKFADLDCLGSAIGMAKACESFGKKVNIVLDTKRNLADCLVQRMVENNMQNLIVLPESAGDFISEKTLLIVMDTHTEVLVESAEVFNRCRQVVVIDHHRKLVNHIEKAVIFYHEPYASSASEMVTELVQYFGDNCKLSGFEAEALLSGIMLDTRNFVIRTGVRTFEAAAYLRKLGADTVEVRKLFASSMDSYQRKTRVVSSAEIYKSCAIASCDFTSDDLRIVAPQAADELLNISGVKASFVLYEQNDVINVSARSMGAMNVQRIMEKMGGGGHHTMAAAQVPNSTCDKVRQSLLEIIDSENFEQK